MSLRASRQLFTVPHTTTLPLRRRVVPWWENEPKTQCARLLHLVTVIKTYAKRTTVTGVETACTSLLKDVQQLQRDSPLPTPATNVLWQASLSHYRSGAALCKSGAFTAALADFSPGTAQLGQAYKRIHTLTYSLGP